MPPHKQSQTRLMYAQKALQCEERIVQLELLPLSFTSLQLQRKISTPHNREMKLLCCLFNKEIQPQETLLYDRQWQPKTYYKTNIMYKYNTFEPAFLCIKVLCKVFDHQWHYEALMFC